VCCLRHTAAGHVEPPVTHQEVLVEQRSIWAQHGLSAAIISAHVKHLQKGHISIKVVLPEGSGHKQDTRWTLMWQALIVNFTVSLLSCPRTQLIHRIESVHPPRHHSTIAVLRNMTKEAPCT